MLGVTPPRNPEAATTDAESLAWALAHTQTDAERRDMAGALDARYPTDLEILGARCASGKAGVEVWVINFQTRAVDWDVTIDGAPYASATVKPLSHDYGVLTVPSGTHTVAFVNPSTGAIAASRTTSLACGSTQPTKPSNPRLPAHATRPAHHAGAPVKHHVGAVANRPTGSGTSAPAGRPAVRHGMPHATQAPAVVAPQGAQQGPKVQADLMSRSNGQTPGALAVVAMFAAIAGAGAFARRVMRA